jgi:hypothetical protein
MKKKLDKKPLSQRLPTAQQANRLQRCFKGVYKNREYPNLDFHRPGKATCRSPRSTKKPVFALLNRPGVSNIEY